MSNRLWRMLHCTLYFFSTAITSFGKPAAVRCLHLDNENKCSIFLQPSQPLVCSRFQATEDACGSTKEEAMAILSEWEMLTGIMQPLPTMNDKN